MKSGIIAIVLGLAMIIASIVWADVPGSINYQGRLNDNTGIPLNNVTNNAADGWIDLIFRIVDAETGGTQVWGQIA